ncbi:MAG: hypothetical protein FWC16_00250 [Defluviitaleaceae bacterium]|nr:hypothetical protein [Defluviitaleaceae bacterium]MCL2273333.1 hypothetical protein [Defluviitaleaceae bacterium]
MKDHYDFSNARPNPYAQRMKNGYTVSIHYDSPEDIDEESTLDTIKTLLRQPKLNALHLYLKQSEIAT